MRFHPVLSLGAILITSGLVQGCRPKAAVEPKPDIVATVGGMDITQTELAAEMQRRNAKGLQAEPNSVLEELVLREVLLARARQLGLEQDPDVVSAYKNLLIARLKERELEPELRKVETAAVEGGAGKRDAVVTRAAEVPQVRLAMLRQALPRKASAAKSQESFAKLTEARERALKLPANESGFGALAIDYSDDQSSRYRGGDLGWLVEDAAKLRFDGSMLKAAFALKSPGEISPVIQGADGWYVVRLIGRRGLPQGNFQGAELSDGKAYQARLAKRKEIERAFEANARAQVSVSVYQNHLAVGAKVAERAPDVLPAL